MPRISPITVESSNGAVRESLDMLGRKLGRVPNMMLTLAQAPSALEAYLSLSGAANRSSLSAGTREAIALAVGQANGCEYCVTAHSVLGQRAGLGSGEVEGAREGRGRDRKESAVLAFALAVNARQGHVTDEEFGAARAAGISESEIVEIVMVVALNVFTNWFNHVADPEIDFPRIDFTSTRVG